MALLNSETTMAICYAAMLYRYPIIRIFIRVRALGGLVLDIGGKPMDSLRLNEENSLLCFF